MTVKTLAAQWAVIEAERLSQPETQHFTPEVRAALRAVFYAGALQMANLFVEIRDNKAESEALAATVSAELNGYVEELDRQSKARRRRR